MGSVIEKLKKIEKEVDEALDKIPVFVALGYPREIRKAQELKALLGSVICELENCPIVFCPNCEGDHVDKK